MKKTEWVNPNKMKIDTGHKSFDRQTNIISTGNVIANTQVSNYIRPYNEKTNPVGHPCELGAMQKWDLDHHWTRLVPDSLSNAVKQHGQTQNLIWYTFFHSNDGDMVVHGHVLTGNNHKHVYTLMSNDSDKSHNIIQECIKYITN